MDHVTREQNDNSSLIHSIEDGSVTGLSLSLQALCRTMGSSSVYDEGICKKLGKGLYGESLAIDLIFEDLHHAADLLRHVFNRTDGVDGWAVFPVASLLTSNPANLLQSVFDLHAGLKRDNTLITVPGLPDMLGIIEEIVFAGIPINISLIYSSKQYLKAAEAYLRGLERRIDAGLNPAVPAFISIPIFHLAAALSRELGNQAAIRTSIAVARKIYKSMRTLHTSQQWERVYNFGARPLRLIWTDSNDESVAVSGRSLYEYLVAPFTVAAMSEKAMERLLSHEHPDPLIPADGDDCEEILASHQKTGLSFKHFSCSLQDDAAAKEVKTWISLLDVLARKSAALTQRKAAVVGQSNTNTI